MCVLLGHIKSKSQRQDQVLAIVLSGTQQARSILLGE